MTYPPHQTSETLIHPGIVHGFFGRQGGVSGGVYASLNTFFHKGDDDANIAENRRRICEAMGISQMVTLRQVHQDGVLVVDANTENGQQLDAMVSRTPNLLLAIQTADCVPILLTDPVNRVIGAVHAGWRSAVAGIVAKTIAAMQALGAESQHIKTVVGPCVHQVSYEVGPEVYNAANAPEFFIASNRAEHYMFDLGGYVLGALNAAGIIHSTALPFNTYQLEDQYFSYRRSCHRGEPVAGGQLSVIGLLE